MAGPLSTLTAVAGGGGVEEMQGIKRPAAA